jgi:hypothetical protein
VRRTVPAPLRCRTGEVRVPETSITSVQEKSKHACLLIVRDIPSAEEQQIEQSRMGGMSSNVAVIILLALAGFLIGGAYSTWKTLRPLSIALGVCAALAAAGAIAWLS